MNETLVTLMGNVATTPVFRETGSGSVARFRLAATSRRWDRGRGVWADGHTNFFTVWAWRGLGTNVVASIALGEPLVVQGRLKVRHEERDGRRWMSADVEAVTVGHDLSRGTAAFRRSPRGRPVELTDGAGRAGPHVASAPASDPLFARGTPHGGSAGAWSPGPTAQRAGESAQLGPVPPAREESDALFEVQVPDTSAGGKEAVEVGT